ncbi:MAG: hypothetical protein HOY71_05690 [Nonomuraea sp.]|nr:hypothetical protein [Nonomuraea sp.]
MKVAIVVTLAIVTFFACLLAVMWIGLSWPAAPLRPGPGPPPLAFSLRPVLEVGTMPCGGLMTMQRKSDTCYRLGPGLDSVKAERAEHSPVSGVDVRITLSASDAAAMAKLAAEARGRPWPTNKVAVVIDGEVYATIEIKGPFTGRTLDLDLGLDFDQSDEIDTLVDRLMPPSYAQVGRAGHPRPMYGMPVAITVMNGTFASGGSPAM